MSSPKPLIFSVIDYRPHPARHWTFVSLSVAAFTVAEAAAALRTQLPGWPFEHAYITSQWAAEQGNGIILHGGGGTERISNEEHARWLEVMTNPSSEDGEYRAATWLPLPAAQAVPA